MNYLNKKQYMQKAVRILACLSIIVFLGCASTLEEKSTSLQITTDKESIEDQWGIRVLSIRPSAKGYMLDFRYRIIDPDKASLLVNRNIKPYLIDQKSGAKFMVPSGAKIGPLRQTSQKPIADRNYFILFANPGKYVKPGDKVTVVVGDFRAENLTVE